ncbi:MAG: hypothetical protein V1679_02810, partial [Candidatus Peregrinibacteria bacterium]
GASLKTPKKTPEEAFDYKTLLDKKLTPKQLEKLKELRSTIKANDILKLQENNPDIIAQLYCEPPDTSKEWTFNSHGNKSIERNIGLVDIYRHDLSIRAIDVITTAGVIKVGKRTGFGGNFYTNSLRYIFIFDGYKVKVTNKMSGKETETYVKEYKKKEKETITTLKSETPKALTEKYGENLPEKLAKEGLKQGVDPKYLLALLRQENGDPEKAFGVAGSNNRSGFLNQLRWAATIAKNNENRYRRFGKNPTDSNGHYTLGFLAFNSERYAPAGADNQNRNHFPNIRKIYGNLCGKLQGTEKDIFEGQKLAKRSLSESRKTTLLEVFAQRPGFKQVWENIKQHLDANRIKYDDDIDQDGLTLWNLADRAEKYTKDTSTFETIRILSTKGWSFNLRELQTIHEFSNPTTEFTKKYRKENFPKIYNVSLQESLEIISKTPQRHVSLEMPDSAWMTSDYVPRKTLYNENGTPRSGGGWHSGIDIGVVNYMLKAPSNGRVILRKPQGNGKKGAGYWIDYIAKDRNGEDVMFRFFHCTQESYNALAERIQKHGSFFEKGEPLLKTGASGNATTKAGKKLYHLHLTVKRRNQGEKWIMTDPYRYLPRKLQRKIYAEREQKKDTAKYLEVDRLVASGQYGKRDPLMHNKDHLRG